jgi:hypothetical protein
MHRKYAADSERPHVVAPLNPKTPSNSKRLFSPSKGNPPYELWLAERNFHLFWLLLLAATFLLLVANFLDLSSRSFRGRLQDLWEPKTTSLLNPGFTLAGFHIFPRVVASLKCPPAGACPEFSRAAVENAVSFPNRRQDLLSSSVARRALPPGPFYLSYSLLYFFPISVPKTSASGDILCPENFWQDTRLPNCRRPLHFDD